MAETMPKPRNFIQKIKQMAEIHFLHISRMPPEATFVFKGFFAVCTSHGCHRDATAHAETLQRVSADWYRFQRSIHRRLR